MARHPRQEIESILQDMPKEKLSRLVNIVDEFFADQPAFVVEIMREVAADAP